MVPKRVVDDIRFRCDIADVIGSYLNLQKAGGSFKALCPFHKEKTPSFHVNPQRQIFHCFGCGAGGDVFRFVMLHESVDFPGALRLLAQRAGVRLELEEGAGTDSSHKDQLYSIHHEIAEFFQRCLKTMKEAASARAYLQKRRLSDQIVESFGIGYAPDRWNAMEGWAGRKKMDMDLLEEAGLVLRSDKPSAKSPWYDRFRNRIMFPIKDEQGRVIAFSGRALETDDKTAKYVNSPETPLFHKSRVLYAIDKARKAIVEAREAILCEGQIDVIRCHEAGFINAVASQGTAFTEDHARVIRRYADSVIIMFDADTAGQDAAVKAAGLFMESGLAVRVASLPEDEDPDSFILKRGADGFRSIIGQAASAVQFQIRVLSERDNVRNEAGLMRTARAVLQTIGRSPNAVQRAHLVQEASERLNIPPSALQDDLRRSLRQTRRAEAGISEPEGGQGQADVVPPEELEICVHLARAIDVPAAIDIVARYLPLDKFSDPLARTLVQAILHAVETGRDFQDILRDTDSPSGELDAFVARVLMAPLKLRSAEVSPEIAVKDLVITMWKKTFERERSALPESESDRCAQLTYHLNRLKARNWEDAAAIIESEMAV